MNSSSQIERPKSSSVAAGKTDMGKSISTGIDVDDLSEFTSSDKCTCCTPAKPIVQYSRKCDSPSKAERLLVGTQSVLYYTVHLQWSGRSQP